MRETLKSGNLPHILFYGPPGTGKTSTILAIARELYGPKKMPERVMELNASDERGINVVRDKIVRYAKTALSNPDPKYPSPPFKMVILDEADAMTTEAQSALRKTIEDTSHITRFCFICNYINQIIEPITSRCVKFRFKPLNEQSILGKLKTIADNEKMKISSNDLKLLIKVSHGDMRKTIMYLQNLNYVYKKNDKIDSKDVYNIANWIPVNYLENIWNNLVSHKKEETTVLDIMTIAKELKRQGYPTNNIIEQISHLATIDERLTDKMKSLINTKLANTERVLTEGASEYLQILDILVYVREVVIGETTNIMIGV